MTTLIEQLHELAQLIEISDSLASMQARIQKEFASVPVGVPSKFKLKRIVSGYYIGRVKTTVRGRDEVVQIGMTHTDAVPGFPRGPWYWEVFGDPQKHGHGALASGEWEKSKREAKADLMAALKRGIHS